MLASKGIQIRRARGSDIPQATVLWMEMMDYHLALDPHFRTVENREPLYAEYLDSLLENEHSAVFVAEKARRIVGYTVLAILESPAFFPFQRYGFVAEMCVKAPERRQGIGTLLWTEAIQWFRERNIPLVQLNVSEANDSGQAFWGSLGCREFLKVLWYDIPRST